MNSDYVCIDDEYYDPYFILGVTKDDSDCQITKAFKTRAKKYHPDKAPVDQVKKYERRFGIILQSYEFIRMRRETVQRCKKENSHDSQQIQTFNEEFEKVANPYEFGYGTQERIANVKDYEKFEHNPVNQFQGKKFTSKAFNRIFVHNKESHNGNENESKALIHKTSDGFYGFNTADINNCALVSSFNGLLITGDDFGETGVGYYANNYSDLRHSYSSAKNPDVVLKVPKQKKEEYPHDVKKVYSQYANDYKKKTSPSSTSYNEQQQQLFENVLNDLIEKEKNDKAMILKYNKQYKKELLKQALEGRLDTSPNLIGTLKNHYNAKQLS
jgi:hypothetical protein